MTSYTSCYKAGYVAARTGLPMDICPYRASALHRRRLAWLDGFVAGARATLLTETVRQSNESRQQRGYGTRAIAQRRWQRRAMRRAGGTERYVDRRLREIAAAAKTPTK